MPCPVTWASQIMSALAWLQVSMLSGYGRGEAMCAMHTGIHRAYATAPHNVQATVKAMHRISYRLPLTREDAARAVAVWLQKHAYWWGDSYSSSVLS